MTGSNVKRSVTALPWQALKHRVWRRLLRWRFLLFQRHRYDRLVLEHVAGYPILVLPQVFNPSLFRTGELLAEALGPELIAPGSRVLDMGTGSGIGAIAASRWAARVVAVDINPAAVRCARLNVALNEREARVEVREGDLFAPLGDEQFDTVLFNPPYYPGAPRDALDRAFHSDDVAGRFAAGLRRHLAPEGQALVLLSTDGDAATFLAALAGQGFAARPLRSWRLLNEVLTLHRVAVAGVGAEPPQKETSL